MTPTRRTLLGAAGAAALSRVLLPWRPTASDILLADETPAGAAKITFTADGYKVTDVRRPDITVPAGCVVTLESGRFGYVMVYGQVTIGRNAHFDRLDLMDGSVMFGKDDLPMVGSIGEILVYPTAKVGAWDGRTIICGNIPGTPEV